MSSLEQYCRVKEIFLSEEFKAQWSTSPLEHQIQLEIRHGYLWRPIGVYEKIKEKEAKKLEPTVAPTVEETLAQRGSRYGDFTDHARLCQALILELQEFKPEGTPAGGLTKWEQMPAVHRQAITVICDKLARILSGDPNYDDNWRDIQGYAKLVEDRLTKES